MVNLNNAYFNRFFKVSEFLRSDTAARLGIDNTPSDIIIANLSILANSLLLKPRMVIGKPFTISSGYRCPKLNKAVGGVTNSYHLQGKACDLLFDEKKTMLAAAKLICEQPLCDLVLLENAASKHPWLHVQWSYSPRHKYQVLDHI